MRPTNNFGYQGKKIGMKDYKKVIESINYSISVLRNSKGLEDLGTIKTSIDIEIIPYFKELPELLYIYKFRKTPDDYGEEIEILVNTLSEIKDLLEIISSTDKIDDEVNTIKGKLVNLLKKSESFNVKKIDEDEYKIWEYEVKEILEEYDFKIDFKSDFEKSKRKEYKGMLASEEVISVPHLEGRLYFQRFLILRIIKNLIKQGGDFIVSCAVNNADVVLEYTGEEECDAFLSHADKDKTILADELYRKLTYDSLKIWYDRGIKAYQSIPGEINKGISKSKNGIAIFSDNYKKSNYCMDELYAMKDKSNTCKDFKLIIILYNFDLDSFRKEYPLFAHKRIIPFKDNIKDLLKEIEPIFRTKEKSIEAETQKEKRKEEYIKIYTDEIIDYKGFNPEKNHIRYNHSKKIILENLKDKALTITRIVINTDFPIVENHFNSKAKIKLINLEYEFNSTGEVDILLNQSPLIISPRADINLMLSLYTSTKVKYNDKYEFKYTVNTNETSDIIEGIFEIKTLKIKE